MKEESEIVNSGGQRLGMGYPVGGAHTSAGLKEADAKSSHYVRQV